MNEEQNNEKQTNSEDQNVSTGNLRQVRIDKLERLKKLGINPYPSKIYKSIKLSTIRDNYDHYKDKEVVTAGRIMSWREHGELLFVDILDESGRIQLYIHKNHLKEFDKKTQNIGAENLNLLDIGDFIEVKGKVTKTKRGEMSVAPEEIILISKSLRPIPSEHFGLKDEEERLRQRYVDLILNEDTRELFRRKAKFWREVRTFLESRGFLEVETPVLENTAGGADANPFITHHDALDIDLYLRISMGELWQKRLMVGGFEKTYELGRQFRNEGMSKEHLQDYTQMEFYWAYADYEDSMSLVEELYKIVLHNTFGTYNFKIRGFDIDINKHWERIDYRETILENLGIDIKNADNDSLMAKLKELKTEFSENDNRGRLIDLLWKNVRKNIAGPAFLVGHPVEVSPLAKRKKEDPDYVERYQIIIAGSELGNGYSELNDPVDQAERFAEQQQYRDEGDEEAQMHDHDFVRALEYGMPPVTGFGMSERVFSFFVDKPVRECVLFPILKPEVPDE